MQAYQALRTRLFMAIAAGQFLQTVFSAGDHQERSITSASATARAALISGSLVSDFQSPKRNTVGRCLPAKLAGRVNQKACAGNRSSLRRASVYCCGLVPVRMKTGCEVAV